MPVVSLIHRSWGRLQREAAARFAQRRFVMRNRQPLISFTFDDFPRSALFQAGSVLEAHGLCGTYYVSLGLLGSIAPTGKIISRKDLSEAVERGHELACHTFDHSHAWDTSSTDFDAAIRRNRHAMDDLMPGVRFATLSYPIGSPRPANKRVSGRHFRACRAGGQTLNFGATDLLALKAFFIEQSREEPEAMTAMIDAAVEANGWLIFATHDVCESPTRYGCRPGIFGALVQYAVQSGARILPVSAALREIGAISDCE